MTDKFDHRMFIAFILAICLVALTLYTSTKIDNQEKTIKNMQRDLDYWNENNLSVNISIPGKSYNFRSFDKGKTWYSEIRSPNGVVSMEKPDYNVLKQALAFNQISKRIKDGKPLDTKNANDLMLLEDMGFTIVK